MTGLPSSNTNYNRKLLNLQILKNREISKSEKSRFFGFSTFRQVVCRRNPVDIRFYKHLRNC